MVRIYVSGPMTGYEDLNFPAFFQAEKDLLEQFPDAEIVNPAKFGPEGTWTDCLKRDLAELLPCTHVALLPDWDKSRGANLEHHVADALDFVIMHMVNGRAVTAANREQALMEEVRRLRNKVSKYEMLLRRLQS